MPASAPPGDLEERPALFAEGVRHSVRMLPRTVGKIDDVKQAVRSAGSVAANCIEAIAALGDKDRVMRFRVARKEAKQSQLRLRLVDTGGQLESVRRQLRQEPVELKLILTAIIQKLE